MAPRSLTGGDITPVIRASLIPAHIGGIWARGTDIEDSKHPRTTDFALVPSPAWGTAEEYRADFLRVDRAASAEVSTAADSAAGAFTVVAASTVVVADVGDPDGMSFQKGEEHAR